MASKSLPTSHSESKTPSSTSSISSEIENPIEETAKNIHTPTTKISKHSDKQSPKSPEV